jgi:hypothetical protein
MAKLALIVIVSVTLITGVAADPQNEGELVAPELSRPTPEQLLSQDYITVSGATVDRPGVPQASGPTALDRATMQENNRIDNSICHDC